MESGVMLFIVAISIVVIWVLIEVKRLKHKLFAIFLISLILFFYITATFTLRGQGIDYGTVSGVIDAGKIYFSWLGYAFTNIKSITTNAIKMDWESNQTIVERS